MLNFIFIDDPLLRESTQFSDLTQRARMKELLRLRGGILDSPRVDERIESFTEPGLPSIAWNPYCDGETFILVL